jgi:hypothetical protein
LLDAKPRIPLALVCSPPKKKHNFVSRLFGRRKRNTNFFVSSLF